MDADEKRKSSFGDASGAAPSDPNETLDRARRLVVNPPSNLLATDPGSPSVYPQQVQN